MIVLLLQVLVRRVAGLLPGAAVLAVMLAAGPMAMAAPMPHVHHHGAPPVVAIHQDQGDACPATCGQRAEPCCILAACPMPCGWIATATPAVPASVGVVTAYRTVATHGVPGIDVAPTPPPPRSAA